MAKVKDFMTTDVVTVGSQAQMVDAAKLMRDHDVGLLAVVDGGNLKGVVTDRDLVVKGLASGNGDCAISKLLTSEVFTLNTDDDADDAEKRMSEHNVRRLPVLENGKLVGMVSVGDLAVRSNEKLAGKVLENTGPSKKG
ncbi:MAG: CBS domain-containing protein [Tepidiformaceae bacterium]